MSTSIASLANNGYYQLSNPSGGTSTTNVNPTSSLLQALNATDGSSSGSADNSAFLLDLSPQAQQLLNGTNSSTDSTASLAGALSGTDGTSLASLLGGGGASSTGSLFGGNSNFSLTADQKQAISNILAKYKDAPYTQATFNNIQNDLAAAGLSPSLLSMQDQAKSFDPAIVLLDALNGTTTDTGALFGTNPQGEQTKQTNYMQGIIQQWQSISTDYQAQAQSGVAPAAGTSGA